MAKLCYMSLPIQHCTAGHDLKTWTLSSAFTSFRPNRSAAAVYLAIDDDGAVDVGAHQCAAKGVEVALQGGGRIADGDAIVSQTREGRFQFLDHVMKSDEFLHFNLALLLVDVNDFELAAVLLDSLLEHLDELGFVGLDAGAYYDI